MGISDIPLLSMLRMRMQWHQERQRILAENVANADTPNYRPRDLAPPDFQRALAEQSLTLERTNPLHIATAGESQFREADNLHYEVRPGGNAVNQESEMMQIASNQMDFETMASLYTRSLALIKLAAGGS